MPGDSSRPAQVAPPDFSLKRKSDTGEGMTLGELTEAAVEVIARHEALAHVELLAAVERLLARAQEALGSGTLAAAEAAGLRADGGDAARLADAFGYGQLREVLEAVAGIEADAATGERGVAFVSAWSSTLRLHLPRLREGPRDTLPPEHHRPLLAGLVAAAVRLHRPT